MVVLGIVLDWSRSIITVGIVSVALSLIVAPEEAVVLGTMVVAMIEGVIQDL